MGEVEISARAYVKMSLHAARYPHAAVNGLLLAPAPRSGECLCLTDCVPLFHSHLALSVMLEVALNQVDVWGAQAGLVVAGYYHANAAVDDQSWIIRNWYPSLTCPQLSSWRTMVSAGSPRTRTCECPSPSTSSWKPTAPEPPLLLVLSQGSFSRPNLAPLSAEFDCHGGYYFRVMWRDWEESRQMVGALLEGRAHQHLVDFDCHLDDIREDWTNQQLNAQITQWVGPTNGNT
uniref:ER membrane protein complex subunit 9 n=1 Tax=Ovis aries TaxID=9940 RepID=A0AC11DGF8_SHEEP